MNCRERVLWLFRCVEPNKWYTTTELMRMGISHQGVHRLRNCGWLAVKGRHTTALYKIEGCVEMREVPS